MEKTFYDSHGRAIAYCEDGVHIFAFGGSPVAFLDGDSVYSFSGTHLGWYENGWVRDQSGRTVFFTDNATGSGPVQPVKAVKPVKGVKGILPVKGVKQVKPVHPVNGLSWSNTPGNQFF